MPATLTEVQKRNVAETYKDVEKLIYSTVWQVVRRYGGHFDDLLSEANQVFLEAYESFDGSSSFTNWLRFNVWWRLVDVQRSTHRERSRYVPVEDVDIAERTRSDWRMQDMIEELTEDAALVVKLVVETPAELEQVYRAKGGEARNLRSSIRQYLIEMGWTAARIAESFVEVRRALGE